MLERVLEPEVMDSQTEAIDYDAMDHGEVNQKFVADFLAQKPDVSNVLDLGTGTAQIPLELCSQSQTAQVLGVDLAEWMLQVGRENIQRCGYTQQVRLEKADAKHLPYDAESFSAVMSNSIIHHIPAPPPVLAEAVRVARCGAVLFFRDLLRPADLPTLERLVSTYAAGANSHQRQMFAESLHAALSLDELRQMVAALGFAPATVQQTTDRHWTWCAVKPVGTMKE